MGASCDDGYMLTAGGHGTALYSALSPRVAHARIRLPRAVSPRDPPHHDVCAARAEPGAERQGGRRCREEQGAAAHHGAVTRLHDVGSDVAVARSLAGWTDHCLRAAR